ncbi:GGDEF domain-containing protein [Rhodoferax saidenbachensis]|uniref:diguanylate cyclase n=1 Tax=Rhodoferax saidenbachensis TaxID=1484693 RepID=A0A1P8K578_9BURK|nr:GGDEF domain-containing protein [Rhodoferax saidenbachensis]APW41163.1 GGDEF domain-containing protein [Rhodoferax saidenbachensis]
MDLIYWSPGETVPEYAAYWRWRTCSDLYRRALVGPAFYVVTCVALWLVGQFTPLTSLLLGAAAAAFTLLWWLRWRNRLPAKSADDAQFTRWYRRQWALIYTGYGLWSALVALMGVEQGWANTVVVVVVMAGGVYTAAACIAFTVSARLQAYLLLLLLAPFVLVWLPLVPELRTLVYAYMIIWLWAGMSGRNYCKEYEAQIRLEHALIVSQANNDVLARTDALTLLANRRAYESVYTATWNQHSRRKESLSLIVMDIDHFKLINDTRGHLAGDACLRHIAGLLRSYFRRANDFVARVGGEEFVVLLPDTTVDEAHAMAEGFRALLQTSPCTLEGQIHTMTASFGVGEVLPHRDGTPDATYTRIDSACYAAKQGGRNRVERAQQPQMLLFS